MAWQCKKQAFRLLDSFATVYTLHSTQSRRFIYFHGYCVVCSLPFIDKSYSTRFGVVTSTTPVRPYYVYFILFASSWLLCVSDLVSLLRRLHTVETSGRTSHQIRKWDRAKCENLVFRVKMSQRQRVRERKKNFWRQNLIVIYFRFLAAHWTLAHTPHTHTLTHSASSWAKCKTLATSD